MKRWCRPPNALARVGAAETAHGAERASSMRSLSSPLSGLLFEPIIPPTVAALKELNPELIAPAHCTGWKAVHAIARKLPQAFVQNSLGKRFILGPIKEVSF
jgi:hypothetical protein